jgi:hypothetical protein
MVRDVGEEGTVFVAFEKLAGCASQRENSLGVFRAVTFLVWASSLRIENYIEALLGWLRPVFIPSRPSRSMFGVS